MKITEVEGRLRGRFVSAKIEVIDLTGTENHYQVVIESEEFRGLNRIQQHRLVMGTFQSELATGELHALALQTKTPN